MSRFIGIVAVSFLALCIVSCSPPHRHRGAAFITEPSLDMFGAELSGNAGAHVIKGYFQSSIIGRSEYIYENLDIRLPGTISAGTRIDAAGPGIGILYARGGQGGQISSGRAKGSVEVLEVSDTSMKIRCDLEFSGFTVKGHIGTKPESVKRKGVLLARKGYRLY